MWSIISVIADYTLFFTNNYNDRTISMRRTPNTATLTKAFIESKVSQESIVSKYLNIPLNIIDKCIEKNILIQSVFRDDDINGSMGIQYNKKGRLKVRDFGGFGFFEDVYGVVAYVLSSIYNRNITTDNKQDFYFILKHIAHTFSNIVFGTDVDPYINNSIIEALGKCKTRKAIIELVPRSWNNIDKDIWSYWGVSLSYLNTHFVVPVDQYYINRTPDSEPKYKYKSKDPCYAYILGQNRQGIMLIKLYFPLRNRQIELKFVTNCNVLEGLLNLERNDYDYIIITKSSKDRLSLGNHLLNHPLYGGANVPLNIGVINLPSENYRLKQNEYEWINNKLKDDGMILSLLDFDETGRQGAKYLEDTYDIPYLFITRGELGLPNIGCKDFANLHDKYTINEINRFIKDTLKYVEIKYKSKCMENSMFGELSEYNLPY